MPLAFSVVSLVYSSKIFSQLPINDEKIKLNHHFYNTIFMVSTSVNCFIHFHYHTHTFHFCLLYIGKKFDFEWIYSIGFFHTALEWQKFVKYSQNRLRIELKSPKMQCEYSAHCTILQLFRKICSYSGVWFFPLFSNFESALCSCCQTQNE